jgi:hypothetical protein
LADVYDRWHKSHPKPTDAECGEHKSRTKRMVPTADHGIGKRWQVRYRDLGGRQRKENFHTKAEADNRAAEVDVEIRRGSCRPPFGTSHSAVTTWAFLAVSLGGHTTSVSGSCLFAFRTSVIAERWQAGRHRSCAARERPTDWPPAVARSMRSLPGIARLRRGWRIDGRVQQRGPADMREDQMRHVAPVGPKAGLCMCGRARTIPCQKEAPLRLPAGSVNGLACWCERNRALIVSRATVVPSFYGRSSDPAVSSDSYGGLEVTQTDLAEPLSVGNIEAPRITPLGSLDDDQGVTGMGLENQTPKPIMAIIYNGI